MRSVRTPLFTFLALATVVGVASAARHLRLTDSLPKQHETVTESPSEVRVWFNQEVSMAVSRISLEGPDGDVGMGGAAETDDPKSFSAVVGTDLVPGPYTVTWRTAGDDGHVQRGEFTFSLEAASH